MSKHLHRVRRGEESGFTLVELLVVVVILGILAAVVVFAVGGINDKGQDSACKTDTQTIRTAEEAFFAQASNYAAEEANAATVGPPPEPARPGLVPNFLSTASELHSITTAGDILTTATFEATSYTIKIQDAKCGTIGNTVGQTPKDL